MSFNLCPFLTLSVRNGPSVSFGTNVPWSLSEHVLKKLREFLLIKNYFIKTHTYINPLPPPPNKKKTLKRNLILLSNVFFTWSIKFNNFPGGRHFSNQLDAILKLFKHKSFCPVPYLHFIAMRAFGLRWIWRVIHDQTNPTI